MKSILFLALLLAIPASADLTVAIKNGDFEDGKAGWRGDGKIVTVEAGGHACELKAVDKMPLDCQVISQALDIGESKQLIITLRMRSIQYQASSEHDGLHVVMRRRDGGYTYQTTKVSKGGAWTDLKWVFERKHSDKKYTLEFRPLPGKGAIQIDDVQVRVSG